MALITLLTDFGLRDEYAGVMKGVIATLNPGARVMDITHGIDPQDVIHGATILAAAYAYFPPGSIHVAVVDPGVGGTRPILAVDCNGHRFVAPDNGLLDRVLMDHSADRAVYVENRRYFLEPVSQTFHGRDIFAPVAAHLAAGLPLTELGPAADRSNLVRGVVPHPRPVGSDGLGGQVVAVDRFGNLMSTIRANDIKAMVERQPEGQMMVEICGHTIVGMANAYDSVAPMTLLAIIGSRGLLEIALRGGSAQDRLKAGKGDPVRVYLR